METLEEFINSRHSKETAATYLYVLNHFLKTHPKASTYHYQNIVEYLNTLKKRGDKTGYRVTKLAAIKRYYDYLIWTTQREDHPCKRLTIRDNANRQLQLQDLFTSKELQLLLNRENRYEHIEYRNKVVISLLIYQGLTSAEIERLNVEDVNLDEATVYIKGSKNLLRRTLELHRTQINYFYKYLFQAREQLLRVKTNKLLITKLGVPFTRDSLHAMIQPLNALFDHRKLNPKSIRMSVIANWLNEQKIPLEDVQLMAGHKYPSTTERYRKKDSEMQRMLINRFHPLNH